MLARAILIWLITFVIIGLIAVSLEQESLLELTTKIVVLAPIVGMLIFVASSAIAVTRQRKPPNTDQ